MNNTILEFLKEYFSKLSIFYTEYTVYWAFPTINTTDFKVFRSNIKVKNNVGNENRKSEQKERLYNKQHKKRGCTTEKATQAKQYIIKKLTQLITQISSPKENCWIL